MLNKVEIVGKLAASFNNKGTGSNGNPYHNIRFTLFCQTDGKTAYIPFIKWDPTKEEEAALDIESQKNSLVRANAYIKTFGEESPLDPKKKITRIELIATHVTSEQATNYSPPPKPAPSAEDLVRSLSA